MALHSPARACVHMQDLPDEALVQVAGLFGALGQATRLQILQWLEGQERNEGELAQLCGCSPANISRHMALLTYHALLQREVRGHCTYYRLADASLDGLLDAVHAHLARHGAGDFWAVHARRR